MGVEDLDVLERELQDLVVRAGAEGAVEGGPARRWP
jgi:hypothetical protein